MDAAVWTQNVNGFMCTRIGYLSFHSLLSLFDIQTIRRTGTLTPTLGVSESSTRQGLASGLTGGLTTMTTCDDDGDGDEPQCSRRRGEAVLRRQQCLPSA